MTPEDVLAFWFGAPGEDAAQVAERQSALWWGGQPDTDARIAARFAALHAQAVAGGLGAWTATPRGRLAAIVVLDQFSRCLHRGTPGAFAQDARARRWCLEGLDAGEDWSLDALERVFFYLPLEHSESREDQARSVALFEALAAQVPAALATLFEGYARYARAHRDIVERFGRFPHRNAILGRASSAEEVEFLKQPGSSF